jgi:mRNA-degrading endonuclease RelE of RelBE toxin-antitoxin system
MEADSLPAVCGPRRAGLKASLSLRVRCSGALAETIFTDEQSPWILRAGTIVCGCNTTMRYRLEIKEEARHQLRALPKEKRRNVGRRLDALQVDLSGDVKKLTAKTHEYRLRVGTLRVLFTLEKT